MKKGGLSTVIVTLILILVSVVAVGIVWVVVRNVIQTGTEGVGLSQFSLSAKILDVAVDNSSNNVSLTIKRNAGKGELTGISFVFSSDANTEVITRSVSLKELEQMNFIFHLNTSVSDLTSVSIVPLIKQDEKEIPGIALDKYTLGKSKSYIAACIPSNCSTLGYTCGNWNNGTCSGTLNCGTCSGGYTCGSGGTCVASCSPTTCSSLGYTCGSGYANGTCSGSLNCGTCGTGYNCVGGSCVLNNSVPIINASSCSQTDVLTAINSATNGSIVQVPIGNCIWNNALTITKGITIRGAGIDNTTIICRVTWPNACFIIPQNVDNVRITGFTFDGDAATYNDYMAIRIGTWQQYYGAHNFRIDNNKFKDFRKPGYEGNGMYVIRTYGYNYGVIDHNVFYDCRGEIIYLAGDGTQAYARDTSLGKYETGTVFIEDNQFILSGIESYYGVDAVDANEGARFVFRYNKFQDTENSNWVQPVDTHGFCVCDGQCWSGGGDIRGTLSYEIYGNNFTTKDTDNWQWAMNLRAGKGVIFNNIISGSWDWIIRMTNERSYNYGGCQADIYATPKYENQCHVDSDAGGLLINEGYVNSTLVFGQCRDQINGVYIWNNTVNKNPVNSSQLTVYDTGYTKQDIVEGRDYFFTVPASYTPYPYPHPLTLT